MHFIRILKPQPYITLLAAVLFYASPAHAGWMQEKGKCFFASSIAHYTTTNFVTDGGSEQSQPRFTKNELNLYGECGWREDVTLGFNAFTHKLDANDTIGNTHNNIGLADTELFARFQLYNQNGIAIAFQPILKLPSFYEKGSNPRGGTDEFDLEPRVQLGYGFDALGQHHYAKIDLGYRLRGGDWGDQWKLDATLGIGLTEKLTFMPQLFITQRVEDQSLIAGSTSAVVQDYDLAKAQISLVYQLTETTALQLGGFSHIRARNTGDGEGAIAALWFKF